MSWWSVFACRVVSPTPALEVAVPSDAFTTVEPRVEIGTFVGMPRSTIGDSRITVVRLDLRDVEVGLLNASELGGGARSAAQWARDHDLRAATNAALFETDYRTATFHMRRGEHVNQLAVDDEANHFLLLDPFAMGSLRCASPTAPASPCPTRSTAESGAFENDDNAESSSLPFVLGVRRRSAE